MSVVVDGQVVVAAGMSEPLSAGGIITGGSSGFTDDEVRDLMETMRPERR